MKIRRDASGPGPHLEWRVRLMGAGAIVALIGIWADATWLVNIAIGLLFLGFLLRFAGGRSTGADEVEGDPADEGSDDDEELVEGP